MSAHGGVVFRVGEAPFFLPASIALKLIPLPAIAAVPGGPPELSGVALVDGAMIPVLDASGQASEPRLSRTSGAMLVCSLLGETLGLAGIDVVATGRFEVGGEPGEVKLGDETARTFDLGAVLARVREGRWAV